MEEVANVYYADRISDNMSTTPEGYLICHGAPLCRTATKLPQLYTGNELGLRTRDMVEVYRSPEDVLSQKFLASLEGKPITDTHPPKFLDSTNAKWHIKGHAQNIRMGPKTSDGEQTVVGDLVITDEELIHKIKSGVRDLSVGYECHYDDNGDGTYRQRGLAANHIAVVPNGRAGKDIRIYDADDEEVTVTEEMLRSGEPRSWDELAEDINNRMGGNVRKSELGVIRDFIKDTTAKAVKAAVKDAVKEVLAQKLPQRDNMEVESFSTAFAVGEHPALQHLRKIRPLIERSDDPEMIYKFNDAVRAVKRLGNNLVPVSDSTQQQTERKSADACAAFEKGAEAGRKREMAKFGHKEDKFEMRTDARDSRLRDDEVGDEWNRLGDQLRDRKSPHS